MKRQPDQPYPYFALALRVPVLLFSIVCLILHWAILIEHQLVTDRKTSEWTGGHGHSVLYIMRAKHCIVRITGLVTENDNDSKFQARNQILTISVDVEMKMVKNTSKSPCHQNMSSANDMILDNWLEGAETAHMSVKAERNFHAVNKLVMYYCSYFMTSFVPSGNLQQNESVSEL